MKTRDFIKKYLPNWRDTREDAELALKSEAKMELY